MRKRVFIILGLVLGLALVPGLASAHHPEVAGEQDCDGTLTYTVTAWNGQTEASRTNPDIRVKVDDVLVQTGAFNKENGFQFTGTVELGEPKTVVVWAKAFANWGNGTEPGPSRQVTVYKNDDCPPPTSSSTTSTTLAPTTTVAPTTTTVAPTSTVAQTTTSAPPTTVGETTTTVPAPASSVAPTTIEAPTTTAGGSLPFSGSNSVPILLAGIVLVAGGYLALRFSRRNAEHND